MVMNTNWQTKTHFFTSFPDTNSTHIPTKRKATGRIKCLVRREESRTKRRKERESATECNNTVCHGSNVFYRRQAFMNTTAMVKLILATASRTPQQWQEPYRAFRYQKEFCRHALEDTEYGAKRNHQHEIMADFLQLVNTARPLISTKKLYT